MATDTASAPDLVARAEAAWAAGDGASAAGFFERAAQVAENATDAETRVTAVLGLARCQRFNITPGRLPVRLYAVYRETREPVPKARLAAALARCWAYASEPARARPFAAEALLLAEVADDPALTADALDAALVSHWGPDELALRRDWADRLGDVAAHVPDPETRLQAHLWELTVAWEVLDLPQMHRAMRAIELLADESPRARFFAASRRLPLELLRMRLDLCPALVERATDTAATAVIPDAAEVLHSMRGYVAWVAGDTAACAREARAFEDYAVAFGVAPVRAEAAVMWLGAARPDKVAEMIGAFTAEVLAGLPRDSDWLLTMQCTLEGALAVGDRDVTASVVGELAPYAGRSVVNAGAVMWHGVTDDTLARAYALLGDAENARRHRTAALATYERVGARWWADRLAAGLPGAAAPADDRVAHLHRQPGGLWLVGREGATFVLPPLRGLDHLHRLLSTPDRDVSAVSLVGSEVVAQPGLEVLDERARRAYRQRLDELGTDGDADERAWLFDQLRAATGLGGRRRTAGSIDERARIAVRKALVAALARIAEADPRLGRHLRDHVRTGAECRYETDPEHPVTWLLDALAPGGSSAQPRWPPEEPAT